MKFRLMLPYLIFWMPSIASADVREALESVRSYDETREQRVVRELYNDFYDKEGLERVKIAKELSSRQYTKSPILSSAFANLARFGKGLMTRGSEFLDELTKPDDDQRNQIFTHQNNDRGWSPIASSHELSALESLYHRQLYGEFIRAFDRHFKKRKRIYVPERIRLMAAGSFRHLRQYEDELKALEPIAMWFPASKESVLAMERIFEILEDNHLNFKLSKKFLISIGRNDVNHSGGKQFVFNATRNNWVRYSKRNETGSVVERIELLRRAKLLDQIVKLIPTIDRMKLSWDDYIKKEFIFARVLEDKHMPAIAIKRLQKLIGRTHSSRENFELRYLTGQMLLRSQRYQEAANMFATIKNSRGRKMTPGWYRFLALVRAQNFQEAQRLIERSPIISERHHEFRGAVDYWKGRMAELNSEPDKSQRYYRKVLRERPNSIYALMIASLRRDLRDDFTDTLNDFLTPSGFQPNSRATYSPSRGRRVASATSSSDLFRISYHSANANRINIDREFPIFSHRLTETLQKVREDDPLMLLSVMKAESRFNFDSISWVGARGLMQIMPYTGRSIAAEINDQEFHVSDLMQPELNIIYGSVYLNLLRARLSEPVFIAAAYNAGPKNLKRWLQRCQGCQLDEFIELISFSETRNYVKKVLVNLASYNWIYHREPLKLDMKYVPSPSLIDDSIF